MALLAPEPDEIFKDLLKSKKHGQFLETYIKNNDPLLLFDSPITLKTPVPATSRTSGCGKRGLVMNYYARTGGFILLQQEKEMEKRPTFYFPDDRCGPDLIFFVRFEQVEVPVFVQVKLRYSVKTIAGALSTIDPKMFYKAKNGKIFQEELNTPIINKIIQVYVTNNEPYDLRNRSNQQQRNKVDEEGEDSKPGKKREC
ncbi:16897_t:CDS:2 [Rhizophagus irregularis]|nr:16897_t:CDS:2 [Rhizophagus irregularis]